MSFTDNFFILEDNTATLRLKLCLQLFVQATAYCKVFFVVLSFVSCFNKWDWKEVLSRLDL